MNNPFRKWLAAAAAVIATMAPPSAHAGIPVFDAANLTQSIQQVVSMIEQLIQLKAQYDQLRQQLAAIRGARNLGAVLNNPLLHDYIPASAKTVLSTLNTNGYGGLTGAAKALRDADMVYNCLNLSDDAQRNRCQADLARPYQYRAYFEDAASRAGSRTAQIQQLMERAGGSADAKEIAELQARIGAENALLLHELTQINLMRAQADSDVRLLEARARENQRENATRTGRMGSAGGAP